jgi:hypothetical protein
MLPYFPRPLDDDAAGRILAALAREGVSIERETLPDGRILIYLTNNATRARRSFLAPLNLLHRLPEATVAMAGEIALRKHAAHSDLDGWLRTTGYGVDREDLRGKDLRRALLEREDAAELGAVFCAVLGSEWDLVIEAALRG